MVDFLVKNASFSKKLDGDTMTWRHVDSRWIAYGISAKHGKKYCGFLEKPAILFAMFFDLGITTLSNITTKLSFSEQSTKLIP
jgi:hypothetical protein